MPADDKLEQQNIITVGKVRDDTRAAWDRHPYHPSNYGQPEGEVFISDMRPFKVHRSRGIRQKLNEDELTELNDRDAQDRLSEYEEGENKRAQAREEMLANTTQAGTLVAPQAMPVQAQSPDHITVQGGLDASAHPETAIENDPDGVGDPNKDDDDDESDNRSEGQRRVRRPQRSGDTPER